MVAVLVQHSPLQLGGQVVAVALVQLLSLPLLEMQLKPMLVRLYHLQLGLEVVAVASTIRQ